MTADATGCIVHVGPTEATAIGNLLTQAMGMGLVKDLDALRTIVRRTALPAVVKPAGGLGSLGDLHNADRYAGLRQS